jgi:UDP-N-acetylmuramoyl-tripeptide--D-alanyl-D-alanine ligase
MHEPRRAKRARSAIAHHAAATQTAGDIPGRLASRRTGARLAQKIELFPAIPTISWRRRKGEVLAKTVRWDPERLASDCDGRLIRQGGRPIAGAFVDSRNAEPDALFIPLVAARDGHLFIESAVRSGASAFLCVHGHPRPDLAFCDLYDVSVVEVENTQIALDTLAQRSIRVGGGPRVAITGSNGKTTTRSYVAAVVSCAYPRILATRGNFNNHIGLPLSLLGAPHEPQARVLELGMSAPGENHHLAEILEPSLSVVTSIALEHLETMGTLEAIAKAEAEPFAFIPPDGAIVIPDDEPLLEAEVRSSMAARVWRFGSSPRANIRIEALTVGVPTRARIAFEDGEILPIEVQGIGRHNIRNACAALAVGEHLGIDRQAMAQAIANVAPVGDRSRVIALGRHLLIADSYNANPGSMKAALEVLRDLTESDGRLRMAVLGDMLELGPREIELHRELGVEAANAGVDTLVSLGALAKESARAFASVLPQHAAHACEDVESAVQAVVSTLRASDRPAVVLFKGSRGVRVERILNGVIAAFD